ncbi:MAG: hypothetical protein ACK4TI_02415, partial [Nitrososphaerales archaeon]
MSNLAEELYFTWLIPNQLAASRGPRSKEDLKFLKDSGIDCLIRLADIDETLVSPKDVLEAGLEDYHEPVADYCPPSQAQLDRLILAPGSPQSLITVQGRQAEPVCSDRRDQAGARAAHQI